ncbi:MAG: hypothetical protein IJF87_08070 [Erysipelotrichaceae bacterium]|nr:hypothetical protein [Erysipelotrichaceae bacterium]
MKKERILNSSGKKKLFIIAAIFVAFFTIYSLVLPAITLDNDTAGDEPGLNTDTISQEETNIYNTVYDPFSIEEERENAQNEPKNEPKEEILSGYELREDVIYFFDKTTDIFVQVEAPLGAFPEGTIMVVTPIDEEEVMDAVSGAVDKVKRVQAVDITFYYNNEEIEPKEPIKVSLVSDVIKEAKDPQIVHIDDDGTGTLVEQADVETEEDEVVFESQDFSTYVVVETEIETTVITADGEKYNITVSYDEKAMIPEGAHLEAEEILPEDERYQEYYDTVVELLESELNYVRLFDISIMNGEEKVQPKANVNVKIELDDLTSDEENLKAVHISDEGETEVLDVQVSEETRDSEEVKAVEFEAKGFSVYAIVEDEEGIPQPPRVTYVFVDPNNPDFTFLDEAGHPQTTQIIKNGDVLQDVGLPTIHDGEKFQGWYIYDTSTDTYGDQIVFESSISVAYGDASSVAARSVTINADDLNENDGTYHVTVKAYFGEVVYLTFYEDSAGNNILNKVQRPKGTSYNISAQTVAAPNSELSFAGWCETAGTDDDDRDPITTTTMTFDADDKFYPIFKSGHWITFYAGATGSGATYTAPAFVTAGGTASGAQPSNPDWKGYAFQYWTTENIYTGPNGSYVQPSSAPSSFSFNSTLSSDITLYAYWTPADTTYAVVFWQQNVTDSKNATDAEKTYRFAKQVIETGTSGSTIQASNYSNLPNTDDDFVGFKLNNNKSDSSITIKADGTSIINVYFDRQLITMTFDRDVTVYNPTTGTTGTQYGYVDGQYVRITRDGSNWVYTTTEPVYTDYTGTRYNTTTSNDGEQYGVYNNQVVRVYHHVGGSGWSAYDHWSRRQNHQNNNDQRYDGTRYVVNADGAYGFVNGSMVELVDGKYQSGTQNVTHVYEGTRYTQGTTRSFTGLYGQTLQQNGYNWPGNYGWQYTGTGGTYSMSYLGEFVLPANRITGANNSVTTINFRNTNASRTVYYYLQNADGSWPNTYIDSGITSAGTLQLANKFQGFVVDAYQTNNNGSGSNTGTWQNGYAGVTEITGDNINGLGIRYRRLTYTLQYLDSVDNTELSGIDGESVRYGASLTSYKPASTFIPVSQYPGKVWDGKWYKDQACSEEFDWSTTMPNADMVVYAGWTDVYYKVDIDPNGGVLTSSESTFTWLTYGSTIQQYSDITRKYIEDPDGEYKYESFLRKVYTDAGYDPWDYTGYLRTARYVSVDTNTSVDMVPYGGTEPEGTVSYPYDSKRYKLDQSPKGVWALVGWYELTFDEGYWGDLNHVESETPYSFGSEITHDTYIQAKWRRIGDFHVDYMIDVYLMDENGNVIVADSGIDTSDVPIDGNSYADQSESAILHAPMSSISVTTGEGDDAITTNYIFKGWYYNGQVYSPGDVYRVLASLAVDKEIGTDPETELPILQKTIYIYPVYQAVDDLPIEVTHIWWHSNFKDTDGNQIDDLTYYTQFVDRTNNDLRPNQAIAIESIDNLIGESTSFEGYTFKGWARVPVEGPNAVDPTSSTFNAANYMYLYWDGQNYHVDSESGAVVTQVAADENMDYHDMYAVWEINKYTVTVTKTVVGDPADQHIGFVFTPVFTKYSGGSSFILTGTETTVVDEETGTTYTYYPSKEFENVPYGATLQLAENVEDGFTTTVKYKVTTDVDGTEIVNPEEVDSTNGATYTIKGDITIEYTNARNKVSIIVYKTDTSTPARPLSGAQFTIEGETITSGIDGYTDTVDLNISDTDYELTETVAPEGYIPATNPITIHVSSDGVRYTQSNDNAGESQTADQDDDGNYIIHVTNSTGTELPMTGGPGTAKYMIFGSILMAGSLMYEYSLRRKNRKEVK